MLWRAWFDKHLGSVALLLPCLLTGCREEFHDCPVPVGTVHYSCDPTIVNTVMGQDDHVTLETPGGYVRCHDVSRKPGDASWGVGGLLLVHGIFDVNAYYAYDLTCPYCYQSQGGAVHQIDINSTRPEARCSSCESVFSGVFSGSTAATAGPANSDQLPLRKYRATMVGDRLVVTN